MNRAEFLELLLDGEGSGVEFKRDVVSNDQVAREIVAFLNLNGGALLLGVEDDGSISGTTRDNLEEWVAELCRIKIDPPIVPFMDWHTKAVTGKRILAVKVPNVRVTVISGLHERPRRSLFPSQGQQHPRFFDWSGWIN